jgi:DNA-binding transcriptional regulator GbsR (MarR family)
MTRHEQQAEEKLFVEEVAIALENGGLPRMAGRILGYLLISYPPHQSTDEMMKALRASRGSISSMTRTLVQMEMIERLSLPGIRHDYFRLRSGAWEQLIKSGIAGKFRELRRLSERGLELLSGKAHLPREPLEEMHRIYAFLEREFPFLLERYKQKHREKQARNPVSQE